MVARARRASRERVNGCFLCGVAVVAFTGVAREAPVAYREAHPAQTFERP